jgi:hypothetical protein
MNEETGLQPFSSGYCRSDSAMTLLLLLGRRSGDSERGRLAHGYLYGEMVDADASEFI